MVDKKLNEKIREAAIMLSEPAASSIFPIPCSLRGVPCIIKRIELKTHYFIIYFEICKNGSTGQINFFPDREPKMGGYNYHGQIGFIDARAILEMLEEGKKFYKQHSKK